MPLDEMHRDYHTSNAWNAHGAWVPSTDAPVDQRQPLDVFARFLVARKEALLLRNRRRKGVAGQSLPLGVTVQTALATRYLSAPEVAELLAVHEDKVTTWLRRGELVGINVAQCRGRRPRWRFSRKELDRFRQSTATPKTARRRKKESEEQLTFHHGQRVKMARSHDGLAFAYDFMADRPARRSSFWSRYRSRASMGFSQVPKNYGFWLIFLHHWPFGCAVNGKSG
jgi:excisionase family DNA binding protein